MKDNERIALLRKELDITLEQFGEKIGITRSAVGNIEKGRRSLTDQVIKAVAREFNVSEEWLRTGQGEMFVETKESYLDDLGKQYALDKMDLILIETFLELETSQRQAIKDYIIKLANAVNSVEDEQARIDKEVEAYRRELEAEAKGAEKSLVLEGGKENTKKEAN